MSKFDNEQCKTCEILLQQLQHERELNKELLATITSLLKPQPVTVQHGVGENMKSLNQPMTINRRRAMFEKRDRETHAANLKHSIHNAKPDAKVEALEKELGIPEDQKGA